MTKHSIKTSRVSAYFGFLLIPVLAILLVTSLSLNGYQYFHNKNMVDSLNVRYNNEISTLNNAKNKELEHLRTQLEITNIHEIYGRVSISRENLKHPTTEDVWEFIQTLNVWYPEYIMAQAVIESGCGTLMPTRSNNMFGMRTPKTRESVAINFNNPNDEYAKYNNWKESVIDRALWELNVFGYTRPTEEEYLKKLKSYASSPTYISAITNVAKQYKN